MNYWLRDGSQSILFTCQLKAIAEGTRLARSHDRRLFWLTCGLKTIAMWRDGKRVTR